MRTMPGLDYLQLRRQITMREVLDLLGFQPTSRHGPQLRGPCPIPDCSSASRRSFSVHLARQVYHCFACRSHGNALDLWAAARGLSLAHAALDLCCITDIAPPRLSAARFTPPTRQTHRVPLSAPSRNR
jgi:DNA primase